VATELLARRELGGTGFDIASVVLMNGGVLVEMSRPALGQRLLMSRAGPWFARFANRRLFTAQLARVFGRPPAPGVLDAMWLLASHGDGARRLPTTIRFMQDRQRFRQRWLGALSRIDRPVLVAWGARDPVTHIGIAHRLAREVPGATLVTWDDLGHYPHVEDAARVWPEVNAFFDQVDAAPGR